ncbi:hypothetical protein AB0C65_35710 [Nocardia sp. NPDC048505]|uniref:hypothetical protein n=1 Tax=Nocardia sp. NPDC048505 TaxID=3155756 RepID=UPI0033E9F3CD
MRSINGRDALDPALAHLSQAERIATLRGRIAAVSSPSVEVAPPTPTQAVADVLAVPSPLGAALPHAGLMRGQAVGCTGAGGYVLGGLVAGVTSLGHTAAVISVDDRLNLDAVVQMGGRLDRIWCVNPLSSDVLETAGVLADGIDLIVLDVAGPPATPTKARPLLAKLRNHGAVLLVSRGITGIRTEIDLGVTERKFDGLAAGCGRVRGADIRMAVSGRQIRPYVAELALTDGGDGTARWIAPAVQADTATGQDRFSRTG